MTSFWCLSKHMFVINFDYYVGIDPHMGVDQISLGVICSCAKINNSKLI